MLALFFIILAYLFGSINWAIILCKFAKLPDPRSEGSGNPGATNVLRFGGKKLAVLVLLGDVLKGVIPVIIARLFFVHSIGLSIVALAAVLGHMYPIFFRFQGGKGVATALGAIIALSWFVGLMVIFTWLIVALIFRFSSLASMISITLMPLYLAFCSNSQYVLPMILLAVIILYRHRGNIKRLLKGEEPKIGKKRRA